jgi:hypothetical protein
MSCADAPTQPLPPTGQETGIDLGIEAFATLSDGAHVLAGMVSHGRTGAQNRPTARESPPNGA